MSNMPRFSINAQSISGLTILLYLWFFFKPPFGVGPLGQILMDAPANIRPIVRAMNAGFLVGAMLNAAFFLAPFIKENLNPRVKTALLLAIVPAILIYILAISYASSLY